MDASLETQKIKVVHTTQVQPETMLAALKKWGDAGNKKVELAA